MDGGIVANNPTLDALYEFRSYNNSLKSVGRTNETTELIFVLSLGTGRSPILPADVLDVSSFWNPTNAYNNYAYIKQMTQLLINQVSNTEAHVVNRYELM